MLIDFYSLTRFTVTEQHITLLHRLNVYWDRSVACPAIDSNRPYGNSDVYGDIAEVFGLPERDEEGEYPQGQDMLMERIHEEMTVALQIFLQTGVMEPGTYVRQDCTDDWRKED